MFINGRQEWMVAPGVPGGFRGTTRRKNELMKNMEMRLLYKWVLQTSSTNGSNKTTLHGSYLNYTLILMELHCV